MKSTRVAATLLVAAAAAASAAAQRIKLPLPLSELEARARADSNDAAAHYNVALGYWNARRWDDAERALRLAVRLDPKLAEGYLALGRLTFARRPALWDDIYQRRVADEWRQPLEESFRLYRRAFLVNPLVDLRIEAAARPPKSIYWTQSQYYESLYRYLFQGFDDLVSGRYEAAFNGLSNLIRDTKPASLRENLPDFVYYYHGLAAAHLDRWDDAIADFGRLLDRSLREISPDSLVYFIPIETNQYRYMLAVLHHRAGQLDQALARYQEALENDLGLYMAYVRMADLYESRKQWSEAVEARRHAINANPEDPSLLLDLGTTLARAGRPIDAEEALGQALEANARDVRALYYLGVIQERLGKTAEAAASFKRFVALAPSRYERQVQHATQRIAALQ
jgi:tetratricopeptide (TPR) repeat protein